MQGELVNGTRGRVEDFITEREAKGHLIDMARPPLPRDDAPLLTPLRRGHHDLSDSLNGLWPLVKIETGSRLLCNRCSFDVNNTEGKVEAVREQVSSAHTSPPLIRTDNVMDVGAPDSRMGPQCT